LLRSAMVFPPYLDTRTIPHCRDLENGTRHNHVLFYTTPLYFHSPYVHRPWPKLPNFLNGPTITFGPIPIAAEVSPWHPYNNKYRHISDPNYIPRCSKWCPLLFL